MHTLPIAVSLLAAATLAPATLAQVDSTAIRPTAIAAGTCVPIHSAAPDLGLEYGVWAAGDDYKVSFHGDMTFVPYLGAAYPHNQPWSWRTASVRCGEVELAETGGTPARWHDDLRYEYRFAAFTEAYDVHADGLEQTFVFERLPGVGDLVIRGTVASGLVAAAALPTHQEIVFRDADGQVALSYGAAVAVDAGGRRLALATGYETGTLELRVPAAWLASARLPVTVDPLLTWYGVGLYNSLTVLTTPGRVDVGREDEANDRNNIVTYLRAASATDFDQQTLIFDDDLNHNIGLVFSDLTSSWSTEDSACAFVGGADRWVIVLQRHFRATTPTQSRLRAHVHDSGDPLLSTSVATLLTSSTQNEWRPDIGGVASFASGTNALIVFQTEDNGTGNFADTSDSDVRGVLFDASTPNGTFGSPFVIRQSTVQDHERPSVNQVAEGGSSYGWVCMMQVYNPTIPGDDWDLIGKFVNSNGTVTAGGFVTDISAQDTHHQLGPVVAGGNGRYAVLYTTENLSTTPFKAAGINGRQLRVERFDWAPGAAAPDPAGDQSDVVLASSFSSVWEAGGIAFDTNDRSHFGVTYRAIAPATPTLYCARVGYHGELTEGPLAALVYNPNTIQHVGAGACAFDDDHDTFQLAFGAIDLQLTQHVRTQRLGYSTPGPIAVGGTGCDPGSIQWNGSQQIGAEFGEVRVTRPSPGGHFLLASLASTSQPIVNPAVASGCELLVQAAGPDYLGTLPFVYGISASWPVALPEFLPPLTLHFQDWVFDGAQFVSSQRLSVPLIK